MLAALVFVLVSWVTCFPVGAMVVRIEWAYMNDVSKVCIFPHELILQKDFWQWYTSTYLSRKVWRWCTLTYSSHKVWRWCTLTYSSHKDWRWFTLTYSSHKDLTVLCFLFHSQGGAQNKARPDADNMVWSGSSSRDVGFGYSESSVTITVGEDTGASAPEKKEVPIWMQKSTVKGIPLMDGGDSLVCPCFFLKNTSLTPCRKFRSHYLGTAPAVLPILTSVWSVFCVSKPVFGDFQCVHKRWCMRLHTVIAHRKRASHESWHWEKNPMLHRGIKPASVLLLAFQSEALPAELSCHLSLGAEVLWSGSLLQMRGAPCQWSHLQKKFNPFTALMSLENYH